MTVAPATILHDAANAKDLSISTQEIERKWVVVELPDVSGLKGKEIRQGYIAVTSDGTEVRLRQKGERYFQTIKSEGGLVRNEIEVELTQAQYDELWHVTVGRRLEKTRYEIPFDSMTIELDVYKGSLVGLYLAEVEFGSVRDSEKFSPPAWFGREVTEDKRYKNKNLALNGVPSST
jgi:adenylate cyclase